MWNVECGMWEVECRMWEVGGRMQNVECGMWEVGCGRSNMSGACPRNKSNKSGAYPRTYGHIAPIPGWCRRRGRSRPGSRLLIVRG